MLKNRCTFVPFLSHLSHTFKANPIPHKKATQNNTMTNSDEEDFELPFKSMFTEPIILNNDYKGYRDSDVPIYTEAQLLEETKAHSERHRARERSSEMPPPASDKLPTEGWGDIFVKQETLQKCTTCSLRFALDKAVCPACETPLQK